MIGDYSHVNIGSLEGIKSIQSLKGKDIGETTEDISNLWDLLNTNRHILYMPYDISDKDPLFGKYIDRICLIGFLIRFQHLYFREVWLEHHYPTKDPLRMTFLRICRDFSRLRLENFNVDIRQGFSEKIKFDNKCVII